MNIKVMENDLHTQLSELHEGLAEKMRVDHKRDLPLQELLTNRWERASKLGWGEGSSVYQSAVIIGEISVGENTWVGPNVLLDGSAGLSIGSNCSISSGAQIYTHDSVRRRITDGVCGIERAPTTIGDSCHIGSMTVISKGVTIGHHSIVGAHSFLKSDTPPYSVAYGVPASVRGMIEIDDGPDSGFTVKRTSEETEIEQLKRQISELKVRIEEIEK